METKRSRVRLSTNVAIPVCGGDPSLFHGGINGIANYIASALWAEHPIVLISEAHPALHGEETGKPMINSGFYKENKGHEVEKSSCECRD